jgi:predicted nucleic acid-binding protein
MDPVLVDTSVWIDFFKGITNAKTKLVKEYLEMEYPVYICPLILQEVLQGIRKDEDYVKVKHDMLNLEILLINQMESSIGAADLYRDLRKQGITIRRTNDCIIAYYAIYFDIHLVHRDKDFDLIADKTNLKIM